ncbi:zinc finger protein castor homolog 1-like isoform X2 [Gigantopelta aegis]|uniref:zinc finger protein castor homolog 1-like isoform X2 n=1 Tax=Gigantopelta aegis TaxID=1735272 RepID=UPI001B8879F4|nr:zinc finger protein castor homolog 1-like isoform X2 [Gigantopelta aegis]
MRRMNLIQAVKRHTGLLRAVQQTLGHRHPTNSSHKRLQISLHRARPSPYGHFSSSSSQSPATVTSELGRDFADYFNNPQNVAGPPLAYTNYPNTTSGAVSSSQTGVDITTTGDIQFYETFQYCGRDDCPYSWHVPHYHCNHPNHPTCEYISKIPSDTKRHVKLHDDNDDLIAHGFKRYTKYENCSVDGCLESKRSIHTHCLTEGCHEIIRYSKQLTPHKQKHDLEHFKLTYLYQDLISRPISPGNDTPATPKGANPLPSEQQYQPSTPLKQMIKEGQMSSSTGQNWSDPCPIPDNSAESASSVSGAVMPGYKTSTQTSPDMSSSDESDRSSAHYVDVSDDEEPETSPSASVSIQSSPTPIMSRKITSATAYRKPSTNQPAASASYALDFDNLGANADRPHSTTEPESSSEDRMIEDREREKKTKRDKKRIVEEMISALSGKDTPSASNKQDHSSTLSHNQKRKHPSEEPLDRSPKKSHNYQ